MIESTANQILIVDDDKTFAQNFISLIKECDEKIQVNHCISVNALCAYLKRTEKQPDLIFMDIVMPEIDGIEGLLRVREKYPTIPVIMLTVSDDNHHVVQAIKAGGMGYLLKDEIHKHIRLALELSLVFTPSIAQKLLELFRKYTYLPTPSKELGTLTHREQEITELLAKGFKLKEISDNKLFCSYKTVRKHVENIYRKVHINSQQELINLYRGRNVE